MSLEQWSRNGWLQQDDATVAEIQQLFEVVDRDLADAQATGLSADGRFQHAYDAALQQCMIALRACGYRMPKGSGHHKRGIESLRYALGNQWAQTSDHLERCSRLRGQGMYERIGIASDQDAEDLIDTTRRLRTDVVKWLKNQHPKLVPPGI